MKTTQSNSEFAEILLISAKNQFEEDYPLFHYKGQFQVKGQDCTSFVHVIIFNCDCPEKIISLIESEVEMFQKVIEDFDGEPEKQDIYLPQINDFSELKEEINNPVLRHDPPQELLDSLSQKVFPGINKSNTIFLSRVHSIVEL